MCPERLWQELGAHVRSDGVRFAVWAPRASAVAVIGDFNAWKPAPLQAGAGGIWSGVLAAGVGDRYRFAVTGPDGVTREKADPWARAAEVPPANASVITASEFTWTDGEWLAARAGAAYRPVSVYEVHLGSWRRGLSYRDLAGQLTAYVVEHGFTHVELLPVMEHPYGGSWGYQVTGYFAPTSRFGSPDDLRYLIDTLHAAGVGVILDWVPAHFPKDDWALARFDGEPLYEHADPSVGEHPDWGTYVFDLGRPQVRDFLAASALYWLEEFHADALRVDAVASMLYLDFSREPGEWTPNEYGGREDLDAVAFFRALNDAVHVRVPGALMIAEESTAWDGVTRPTAEGGLGFDLKWNLGWMHDTLGYLHREPVHRPWHHGELALPFGYAFSEHFLLPLSHDEVVHGKGSLLGKMPGDRPHQLANLRALLACQWATPGKQLLFMGGELGQESEWAEARELDWWLLEHPEHAGVQRLVGDLNRGYRSTPALWSGDHTLEGFSWLDGNDAGRSVLAFLRRGVGEHSGTPELACIANFADVEHGPYRIGLPAPGVWSEVLNTDAAAYAGAGGGNLGSVTAEPVPWQGQPASAEITVPALTTLWLRRG